MRQFLLTLTFLTFSFVDARYVDAAGMAPKKAVAAPALKTFTAEDLYKLYKPAVVKIQIKQQNILIGWGTGFFVSGDGSLITNYHVIRSAIKSRSFRAEFVLSDGQIIRDFQIGRCQDSRQIDLCLLKLPVKPKRFFQTSSYRPSPGESLYVIGHPQGLDFSITNGIVSAVRESPDHIQELQITAAISPGNSGGPIFNSHGTLLGVTSKFLKDGQNLNFGILTSEVETYLRQTVSYASIDSYQHQSRLRTEELMNKWLGSDLSPALESALQGSSLKGFSSLKVVKFQFGNEMIQMTIPKLFSTCTRPPEKSDVIMYNCSALGDAAILSVQRLPSAGIDSLLELNGKQILKTKPLPIVEALIHEGTWAEVEHTLTPEARKQLYSMPGIADCQRLKFNPTEHATFSSDSVVCRFSVTNDSEPDAYSYSIWIQKKSFIYGFHIWMDDRSFVRYFKNIPSLAIMTAQSESVVPESQRQLASLPEKLFSLKLAASYEYLHSKVVDRASTIHMYGKARASGGRVGPSVFVVQELKESFSPREIKQVADNLFHGTMSGFGASLQDSFTTAENVSVDGMLGRMYLSRAKKDKESLVVFHTTLLSDNRTFVIFGYADSKEGDHALEDFRSMCTSFKRKLD